MSTITLDYIRELYMQRPALMASLKITEREGAIIHFVRKERKATAAQVADEFGISIQNASTSLKRLYEKGYLSRGELTHETGGIEYSYSFRVGKESNVKTLSNTPAQKAGESALSSLNGIDFSAIKFPSLGSPDL